MLKSGTTDVGWDLGQLSRPQTFEVMKRPLRGFQETNFREKIKKGPQSW